MEITLQPEDNTRLANLCGALDENIKQIETALEVNINRRGGTFNISGKTDNNRVVDIAGDTSLINTFVQVKIIDVANPKRLRGEIIYLWKSPYNPKITPALPTCVVH